MTEDWMCRFGDQRAEYHVALSEGCIVYPDDREQYLCRHHLDRATPLGEMVVIEKREVVEWTRWDGSGWARKTEGRRAR